MGGAVDRQVSTEGLEEMDSEIRHPLRRHRGSAKEMSAKRKHRPNWDDGFFMARADPERRAGPVGEGGARRRGGGEPLKIRSKRFNFGACRTAWLAIGLIQSERHVRAH